jgi:hypothetical protein
MQTQCQLNQCGNSIQFLSAVNKAKRAFHTEECHKLLLPLFDKKFTALKNI